MYISPRKKKENDVHTNCRRQEWEAGGMVHNYRSKEMMFILTAGVKNGRLAGWYMTIGPAFES